MMQQHHDEQRPPSGVLPGEWDPPPIQLSAPPQDLQVTTLFNGAAAIIDGALSSQDCQRLIEAMQQSGQASPVNVQGRQDLPDDRIGSVRATAWAPALGRQLWARLQPYIPPQKLIPPDDLTSTDWHHPIAHRKWRAINISPVLRFMRYEAGGQHYAHYDAGFDYGDGRRTLMSLVLYLTTADEGAGGRLRFIRDQQEHLPIWQRDHQDWPREVLPHEVIDGVRPIQGRALIFDHRICHDVELYTGQTPRIIIRGDVVFEAIP